jgi:sensor domain CHASE-containing protein
LAPLAGLVGAALVLSGIAVYIGSARQDSLQRRSEERIVAQSVRGLDRALSTAALDYGWWDDAVRFLGRDLDPDWADANIGPYIAATFGYEVSLVVGADGRAAYGQLDGERGTAEAAAALGADLHRLVARVREAGPAPEPKTSFAVLRGPGSLYAAAASPILPQAGSPLARPDGPPNVLVFAKRLDQAFLQTMEADFGLASLAFGSGSPAAAGLAAVGLPGPDGAPVGMIVWRPLRPGQGQLVWLLPALLGSVLFCGFTALVVRNGERANRAIQESEARFRDVAEASSDWIWETDRELRLTYVSDHGARGCGRHTGGVVGRHLQDLLLPPADPGQRRQGIPALAGGGRSTTSCAGSAPPPARSPGSCGLPASRCSTPPAPCAATAAPPPTSPRKCPLSSRRATSPSTTP